MMQLVAIIARIWRRCVARRANAFAVGWEPTASSSAGFTNEDAAVAMVSPLVEPAKNLGGKAFRFGIFRDRFWSVKTPAIALFRNGNPPGSAPAGPLRGNLGCTQMLPCRPSLGKVVRDGAIFRKVFLYYGTNSGTF